METTRKSLELTIGVAGIERPGEDQAWRFDAVNQCGERWTVEHPDYYQAVVMLAGLVGFDLYEWTASMP